VVRSRRLVLRQNLGSHGAGEWELHEALRKRGLDFRRQQPIPQPPGGRGRYWFVDFARWPLAVELTWHGIDPLNEGWRPRTLHIVNQGWHLIYIVVCSPTLALFDAAGAYVAAHARCLERGQKVPRLDLAVFIMRLVDGEWRAVCERKDPWAAERR